MNIVTKSNVKRPFVLTMQNPRTKDQITVTVVGFSAHDAQVRARREAPNFSVCLAVR